MDKPLNAILNTGEGPKRRYFCDRTCDYLTGCVALLYSCPGIDLGAFDRQGDFLLLLIDAKNLDFLLLADLEHFTGVIDTAPGELADMYQSVCSSQVNKGAKVGKVTHHAMANFSWFQLIEKLFTPPLPPFLRGQPL